MRFPGSLDHDSARRAVERLGGAAAPAWHADPELPPDTGAVLLPGGFSYGDHLRCGAIASRAPIMAAVRRHAEAGGRVIGICNGFQVLCEAGLLPGALRRNATLSFVCRQMDLEVADAGTPWTAGLPAGASLSIPIKNNEGAWYGDPSEARVVLRYGPDNPLGSTDRVAGVANAAGNVMGLMPHPEEACDPLLGSTDGGLVLAGPGGAMSPTALSRHRQLGLTDDEAARIPELLGREPERPRAGHVQPDVERALLLQAQQAAAAGPSPRPGDRVLQGPGENAGVVDVGDGLAVALKIESHNHPSAVEPFEGAATGVGGIVRDILAMGARPIALLDSLRFGELTEPAQPPPVHPLGRGHRPLRQLHRRAHRGRRGVVRRPLRGVVPGQRHVRGRRRPRRDAARRGRRARATPWC